jgi:hypothetical protein
MGSWFYPLYTHFLEKATEGLSLLEDLIRGMNIHDQHVKETREILHLVPRRDRSEFTVQARDLIEDLDIHMDGSNVSAFFSAALDDESLLRLDRFCYLTAALIVWSLQEKP